MPGRFPMALVLEPGLPVRLAPPAADAPGPCGVLVTIRVEAGAVAIATVAADGVTVVDEARAEAAPDNTIVALLAEDDGSIVITSATDGSGAATLLDVESVPAPALDEWPTALSEPRLVPAWSRYYGTHGDDLGEKARYRRYAGLTAPWTVRWRDGVRFRVAPADQLSRVVYVSGTYEPHTLRLLRAWLAPGDTFADVGANAGVVTLAAARWVGAAGRVIAIEPSAREFERLADHVALNGLAQVTPIRAAVAAVGGSRTLRVAAAPRGGLNTLGDRFAYPDMPTAGFETVDARPLDALLADAGVDRVHAIKLDVEGSETEAIDGASRTLRASRPVLVLEVCASALAASGSSVEALATRLSAADYVCFDIDDATGALIAADALAGPDRNVAALPREQAAALLERARSAR